MSNYNSPNVNTSYHIAHLLNKNWTACVWSCESVLLSVLMSVLLSNCVFLLYISPSVNMTPYSTPPRGPFELNSQPTQPCFFFFLRNRPGPATAECPGAAVHLQCARHGSLSPDARLWAVSSGQLINE